jgi:ribosomal protein S12 methylthiotransferase
MDDLIKSAESLASQGTKELILIAQDLTFYGLDIYKERKLAELINRLSKVEGIEWIRLQYAYPSGFPMEVIDEIKDNPKVCNYLDMPLQHSSNNMLKLMKRGITKEKTNKLIHDIREKNPGISIRTTLIVGFPGETEEDFQDLCDWVEEMKFERLGVFTYSHEENTSAYALEDDVPAEVKQERANTIMEIQQEISYELNQEKVGKSFNCLFDRVEGDYFVGRTEFDSPEVDNEVLLPKEGNYVRLGDFAEVKVVSAEDYDLHVGLVE